MIPEDLSGLDIQPSPRGNRVWLVFVIGDIFQCMWFNTRNAARAFIAYVKRYNPQAKLSAPERWCRFCFKEGIRE